MIKVAINGFGRIGRLAFRELSSLEDFEVVAINDLTEAEQLAYLLKYDTNHRGWNIDKIGFENNSIIYDNKRIQIYSEKDPAMLPWGNLGVDVVLECTGAFTKEEDAIKHIKAGAKKVLISAPGDGDMKTIETNMDVAAIDSHLNRLRKDIYEAGNGVDTQEVSLGNASGVALKFRYADLDTDTDDLAAEFTASLEEVLWFIKIDMLNKGIGDYLDLEVDIIFNTDMIINESETIADAGNSVGIISEETIIANHPWVTDVQAELDRVKKEKEAKIVEMQELMKQQNPDFGDDEDNSEGEGAGEGGEE